MWGERGSALGEQLIVAAFVALVVALAVALYLHTPTHAYTMIGLALAAAVLVFTTGMLRDRRAQRLRVESCRLELLRAAAAHQAALDATFFGQAAGGPAAFGIAGASRKLVYARAGDPQVHVHVLEFEQLTAVFARPEGERRFRLEVRARANDDPSPREALFLTVTKREEAERWIKALAPHFGERAKMVERN